MQDGAARSPRRRGERKRQRQHRQQHRGKDQQRVLPAELVDHRDCERRKKELPERSGRGACAEGDGAPLSRQELGECADHQRERATAETETDQHAGRQVELKRRRCVSHPDDADDVEHRAADQHPGPRRTGRQARRRTAAPRPTAASRSRAQARTTSRPQPLAAVIGVRKNPKVERGPKLISADQAAADEDDDRRAPGWIAGPTLLGDYAAAATGRATGFSTIGRLMTAEATPKNADSHQTRS